ncbi:MAG: hypothetical protein WCH65_02485 [bacterium]
MNTGNHVVHELIRVDQEYISSRHDVVAGEKVIEAKTHVSIPFTVVVTQVKVFIGMLVSVPKANDHDVGVCCIPLVVTLNEVFAHHIVTTPVIVCTYHVLVKRLICIVSPLFIIQVSPLACQLIIRYPEVVLGVNDNVIGTGILIIPAVYIFVVYQVHNSADPLETKLSHSGTVSRIAKVSAIYLSAVYCEGISTSVLSGAYLTGTICLYIFNPNA